MMRSRTAIAVAILALFALTSCNDYGNTFQANTGANISFISPSNATACVPATGVTCSDLTITLTDSTNNAGFVANTYVTWDQAKIKTIPLTDSAGTLITTQISAVVPAADLTKPGKHFVQTQSPFSGAGNNGLSNPVAFFVNPPPNPVPTITSISPSAAAPGSPDTPITITGTNFLPTTDPSGGSQVNWNSTSQVSLAVSNITSTQIQATVKAAQLANAGTATVTVYNPPAPPPPNCVPGLNCGGNGGGGTSPCPLVTGSTTVTVCTFSVTTGAGTAPKGNAAAIEEETPAISQDGRYVAYSALQNGHTQILARDTCQGADSSCQPRTLLISSALDGTAGSDDSHAPSMSADGRYVAFSSTSPNLVAESAAPGAGRQVYLRDTCFGANASCSPATQLVSTDPNGTLGGTESILPSVSASGRFVAFLAVTPSHSPQSASAMSKLATNTPNSGFRQVFIRDTCLGATNCTPATTRISFQPGDASGSASKPAGPAISGGANHLALSGGNTATLFTRSVAVDDRVFVALTQNKP